MQPTYGVFPQVKEIPARDCADRMESIQHQFDHCSASNGDSPRSIQDLRRTAVLLAALRGLYSGAPEDVRAFADSAYWQALSDGLHVTDDLSSQLAGCRRSHLTAVRCSNSEAAASDAACHSLLHTQGYSVLPPPASSAPTELFAALQRTAQNLRAAGWPPAFLLLYDEVWLYVVDPIFERYER